MSLTEKLERVIDREPFLDFVKVLIEDWEKDEAEIIKKKKLGIYSSVRDNSDRQSGTRGAYLEAASAWAEAIKEKRMP
jgi:hypothetical protein